MYTPCVYKQKSPSVITYYYDTKRARRIRMYVGTLTEAGEPTSGRGCGGAVIKHDKWFFCTRNSRVRDPNRTTETLSFCCGH